MTAFFYPQPLRTCLRLVLQPWVIGCLLFGALIFPNSFAGHIEQDGDTTVIHLVLHSWMFPNPERIDTPTRANVEAIRAFRKNFNQRFATKYKDLYSSQPEKYGRYNWDKVEIQLHDFSGIKVPSMESDLLAIAGEVAPDIFYVNFRKSSTYIEQGFLAPLEDRIEASNLKMDWDPRLKEIIQRDGKTYCIPYGGWMAAVLLYRKDLFEKAGVGYPDGEWTWDDLHEACKRIANPGEGIYAIRFKRGVDAAWYWTAFLRGMGADVLRKDDAGEWQVAFNNREAAQALEFYLKLTTEPWVDSLGRPQRGYAWMDASSAYERWKSGKIAMAQGYFEGDLLASINPDITGIAPVPISPKGLRKGELNHRMMGMYSGIENPVIQDAAWEFMQYYDSDEARQIKTRVMVEGGLGRFVNPDLLEKYGYGELIRLSPKGWKQTYETAFATGEPEPWYKHSNIAYSILDTPLNESVRLALENKLPEAGPERIAVLEDFLAEAGSKAQIKMLEEIPAKQKSQQRITAFLFLITVVIVFATVGRKLLQAFRPPGATRSGWQFSRFWQAYLLLLPSIITILLWQYFPLLRGSVMAFQDYRLIGESTFVGLDNFGTVLWDADWWKSIWIAIQYSLLVIALTFLPPVGLAVLLQEVPRFKILFRTIYYLPAVVTSLVLIYLWKSFYGATESGALNQVLMKIPTALLIAVGLGLLGLCFAFARRLVMHRSWFPAIIFGACGVILYIACVWLTMPVFDRPDLSLGQKLFSINIMRPVDWLSQSETALLSCVLPLAWAGMGPGCLIYLAALKGIADDYYEAADIDGATFLDKILFIVFPILKPLLIINFVGVFIGSWFHAEANIFAMTGGSPSTRVAGLEIFFQAFVLLKFGPATAMAWILGLFLIAFTMWKLRILARVEFKTSGSAD